MDEYLTDQYGISFYQYCKPRFDTKLDPYKYVDMYNPISGHHWTQPILKKNHEAINAKIDKTYAEWLKWPEVINPYHYLNAYPRTPKETTKIQRQL